MPSVTLVSLASWLPLASGILSALILAFMLASGRVGPMDQPNHRSLHVRPIPRSGGLGIVAGILLGAVLAHVSPLLIAGLLLVALVSWADDHLSLPVGLRFASHFLAAALALGAGLLPDWSAWCYLPALLAMVWMTNLYNFMDGANGLAGGMAVFGFAAYGLAASLAGQGDLAFWSFSIAAAAAGFLIFNFDPARIFMGDVGSIPLGFLAAALGLDGIGRQAWPLWFPLLVFSPFIVDATATLLKRGLRGEKVWQAHREHYYQRLVQMGWSHRRLALWEYALMFVVAASACGLRGLPGGQQLAGLAFWLLIFCLLMAAIDRRWRRRA